MSIAGHYAWWAPEPLKSVAKYLSIRDIEIEAASESKINIQAEKMDEVA
jgi:hypothetical protein